MRHETLLKLEMALDQPDWTPPLCSLLVSTEPAMLELAWQALLKAFKKLPRWNTRALCLFDAETMQTAAFFEELDTLPFLSPLKLILLRRTEQLPAAEYKQLQTRLIARMQEQGAPPVYVVLMSSKLDKKSALYTACQNHGLLVDIAVEKGLKGETSWASWLQERIKKEGKTLSFALAKKIAHGISDPSCLMSECAKLLSYVGDKAVITEADITAVCCLEEPESIWQLSQAITSGNAEKALAIMDYLLEKDLSPFAFIASLRHQLQTGCKLAELLEANTPTSVIASHFPQLPSNLLQTQSSAAKAYGAAAYRSALSALTKLEFTLKDRPLEARRFIERLLFALCKRIEQVVIF